MHNLDFNLFIRLRYKKNIQCEYNKAFDDAFCSNRWKNPFYFSGFGFTEALYCFSIVHNDLGTENLTERNILIFQFNA